MMDIVMVALVVVTMMAIIITKMILEKKTFWWQKRKALFCVCMFESVYTWTNICYGQARFQEHPSVELDPLPRSTLTGERGGGCVRTQCTWLSCIFTVTISHVQHAPSSWLLARSIIISLQNLSLSQSIDSWKSSPADWGQILSTISPGHTMVPAGIACLAHKNSFWSDGWLNDQGHLF